MKTQDGMPQVTTKGLKLFSDEHANAYSIETVAWKNVTFDPNANVRPRDEFDVDKWGVLELVQILRGLPKPNTHPAFHLDTKTGELTILRGNRRYLAYEILRDEDPKNVNYQNVEARIYRDLHPNAQAIIKMDHSVQEKALSRVGLYLSIIECKKMGFSEKQTVATLRGALNNSYKGDKNKTEPNDSDKVFSQYRGFIQQCFWANAIACLEKAHIEKLRDPGKKFPRAVDVQELYEAFLADKAKNPMLTRDTALKGPSFGPMWAAKIAEAEKAEAEGGNVRGATKLSPSKVAQLSFSSVINNCISACINMKSKSPTAWVDVIDPLLVKLEAFMTVEDHIKLDLAIRGETDKKLPEPAPEPKAQAQVRGKKPAASK